MTNGLHIAFGLRTVMWKPDVCSYFTGNRPVWHSNDIMINPDCHELIIIDSLPILQKKEADSTRKFMERFMTGSPSQFLFLFFFHPYI